MRFSRVLALFALAVALPAICRADDFSFTGNISSDDTVQAFTFTVGSTSTVTLRTWSYAGGTNAAGQTIAEGGFDPILALFQGTGPSASYYDQNDDGGSNVPADANTGEHYDTYLQETLDPGTYTVTVMEYDNFAVGPTFGDGFTRDGQGNFTVAFGCSQGYFCDVSGNSEFDSRDSHWAFDIDGVDSAEVIPNQPSDTPEPSSLALLGTSILGAAGAMRKRLFR